jgi:hypothetical protein
MAVRDTVFGTAGDEQTPVTMPISIASAQYVSTRVVVWLAVAVSFFFADVAGAQFNGPPIGLSLKGVSDSKRDQPEQARMAVLVVDCSNSMAQRTDANPGAPASKNPRRWDVVRSRLNDVLLKLATAAPGIEVRVRFFANGDNCAQPLVQVLKDEQDVRLIMEKIPKEPPNKGGTALYRALRGALADVNRRLERTNFDWVFFAVVSDGEDRDSRDEKSAFMADLTALRRRLGDRLAAQAAYIGEEATRFAAQGGFGELKGVGIESLIPVPPAPRKRYLLEALRPGQSLHAPDVAPAGGVATVVGTVTAPAGVKGLLLSATIAGHGSAVERLRPVKLGEAGSFSLELQLPPDTSHGLSWLLTLRASTVPDSECDFDGEVTIPVSFPASQTLPPEEWKIDRPQFVQRQQPASFAATVGKARTIAWDFSLPTGSGSQSASGTTCTVAFPRVGRWNIKVSVTGDDGRVKSRTEAVDVVDADFRIVPPSGSIIAGAPSVFVIEPGPEATSPAQYSASLDGETVPNQVREIRIPALEPGNHSLVVTATSEQGRFEWTHHSDVVVEVGPSVRILGPVEVVEGSGKALVGIYLSGAIGDLLDVGFGGKVSHERIEYPPGSQFVQVQVPIDLADFKTATEELTARATTPSGEPVSDAATITLRRADLGLQLVAPSDGAAVRGDGTEPIRVAVVGDDAGLIGTATAELKFVDGAGGKKDVVATAASKWEATIPAGLRPGDVSVNARFLGGGLRPDIFPREWTRLGAFSIALPTIQIVQIPATAGRAALPGKQFTIGVSGVPAADVASYAWTMSPPRLSPVTASGATASVTPQAWGSMPVSVEVVLSDGSRLQAQESFSVSGESPNARPELSDSTPTLGDASIAVTPNPAGSFRSMRVNLWTCDRSGTRIGAEPAWSSSQYTGDPGKVDVPLTADKLKSPIENFEVEVVVDAYPGDPSGDSIAIARPGRLVPPPLWHWWLACLAAFGGVGWWLWTLLRGNGPIRWQLEFGMQDPGPANQDYVNMSSLRIGRRHRREDGAQGVYLGWSRRTKEAFVPLWYLKERCDGPDADWLIEGNNANLHVHVRGSWQSPFHRFPGPDQGWAEAEESRYPPVDGASDRFSKTMALIAPSGQGGERRQIFLRMKCPRGGDPYMWLLWAWLGLSLVGLVVLLEVFNIVNYV